MQQSIGVAKEIIWGFAGPWYGEYECYKGDQLVNQLSFLVKHGFRSMGIDLRELVDLARRDMIGEFVSRHDLRLTPHVGLSTLDPDRDRVKKETDDFLEGLLKYRDVLQAPIVTSGANAGHRFGRDLPLAERLRRIAEAFEPLAKECAAMGCPLGIENHGDFYCSDLLEVNRMAPHVNIFLDTGNTYLAGEKSIEGCRAAAPLAIGTHFKDHFVHPDGRTLTFVIEGAALGEGDVGLATVYDDLMRLAKAPRLVMQWELVVPKGANPLDGIEKSWRFIRTLPGQEKAGVLQEELSAVSA